MGSIISKPKTVISIPPPPAVLLAHPRYTYIPSRPQDLRRDTALNSVYRMYWAIVIDDNIALRTEIERFWSRKGDAWKVCNIRKPPDPCIERFAVISAIPYMLVAAFNRLIELGLDREAAQPTMSNDEFDRLAKMPKVLETVPAWAEDTPPLESPLILPTMGCGSPASADDEGADEYLAKKNVVVWAFHIFFVRMWWIEATRLPIQTWKERNDD